MDEDIVWSLMKVRAQNEIWFSEPNKHKRLENSIVSLKRR
nr:MAG TPA: hypothetical protein [Bacteriophage sp.]